MDSAAALFSFLSTNESVVAVLGDRIYPLTLPQKPTLPAAVYTAVDEGLIPVMGGYDSTQRPTFEIECHGKTNIAAAAALEAVKSVLKNHTGEFGALTCQAVVLLPEDGSEGYDPDTNTYWASREFEIYLEE